MRPACSLLSVSALLLGALAVGNPFLPERAAHKPVAKPAPRRVAVQPAFWQPQRFLQQSPIWMRDPQSRAVLPADVGHASSASFRVGSAPVLMPAIDARTPQATVRPVLELQQPQ